MLGLTEQFEASPQGMTTSCIASHLGGALETWQQIYTGRRPQLDEIPILWPGGTILKFDHPETDLGNKKAQLILRKPTHSGNLVPFPDYMQEGVEAESSSMWKKACRPDAV